MSGQASQKTDELGALKVLYDGNLGSLRALSERSFTTTLQALLLNIAVVAGLVGGKIVMSEEGKVLGSFLLGVFNAIVVIYLMSKAWAHHRIKKQFNIIEGTLLAKCGINFSALSTKEVCFWRSFFAGSGLFVAAVLLATVCSIASFWLPLVHQPLSDVHQANQSNTLQ